MTGKGFQVDAGPEGIYPMPFFVRLRVSDVARSTAWYTGALGFRAVFTMAHPSSGRVVSAHLRRARYQDILLVPGERGGGEEGCDIYLALEGSVDELARTARAAGAEPVEGPADTPWNTREVAFKDPDGYRLVFTTGPVARKGFDEVMSSVSERMGRHA